MKKILFPAVVLFIMLGMSNCEENNGEEFDPTTVSLIGTWEAEGKYIHKGSGVNTTYNCTLIFHNETEYTQIDGYMPFDTHYEDHGTYVRETENIIYTHAGNVYTNPYKFVDKNTLETAPVGFLGLPYLTLKRK